MLQYDDGSFSGGNTDRPALRRLLVRGVKIDVIVVSGITLMKSHPLPRRTL